MPGGLRFLSPGFRGGRSASSLRPGGGGRRAVPGSPGGGPWGRVSTSVSLGHDLHLRGPDYTAATPVAGPTSVKESD